MEKEKRHRRSETADKEKGRLQTQEKGDSRLRKRETADMEKGRLQTQEKGDSKHRKGETADKGDCKQKKEGTGKETTQTFQSCHTINKESSK